MAEINHRVGIRGTAEKVYEALTQVEKLAQWWTTDTTGEAKTGGTLQFRFNGRGCDMKVVESKPGLVRWKCVGGAEEWLGTDVSFEIQKDENGVNLWFKHSGWTDATSSLALCSTKWGVFMLSLKDLIEKGEGRPFPRDIQTCFEGRASTESKPKNAISWFEIPVKNFERAAKFYSEILKSEIKAMDWNGMKMGHFPGDGHGVSGALIQGEHYTPSEQGSLVYLNAGNDLAGVLNRVQKAGGKVVLPKTNIGEYGFIARFKDTEGNMIALHDMT